MQTDNQEETKAKLEIEISKLQNTLRTLQTMKLKEEINLIAISDQQTEIVKSIENMKTTNSDAESIKRIFYKALRFINNDIGWDKWSPNEFLLQDALGK